MSLSKRLKKVREEVKVSSLFPITHLVAPHMFETCDGLLGSTIAVRGAPFVTETNATLNHLTHSFHQAITSLDARSMCYVTVHRKKENVALGGDFKSSFARHLNDKYHARFTGLNLYKNNIYLTIVLKENTSSKPAKTLSWFKRLSDLGFSNARALKREADSATLDNITQQMLASLAIFKPRLLGANDNEAGFSELMAFLSLIPNGGESRPFKKPIFCAPISKNAAHTFLDEARFPEGHLGQYICSKQLLFGKTIQFQGASDNDTRFGAMLSLKEYPNESGSLLLAPLLALDSEFIATQSFAPLPEDSALKIISLKRDKLNSAKDLGKSQIADLSALEDDIASGKALAGFHHNSLMLLSDSLVSLNTTINEAVKIYKYSDCVLIRETLGMECAFWAQIPGNLSFIVRASLITSHNFVEFAALFNYQTGFRDENHLGSAVTLLETPSKTPVFFNYHSKSTATNPAKGHTVIFGANDSGKTTFASFMDAQMGRYNGKSFFLDRDNASKIYILASGNSRYFDIEPEKMQDCPMNPLQLPDTPDNRSFLKLWLSELVKLPEERDLPSLISGQINDCINYSFEHLAKPYRSLSHVTAFLPRDFQRWHELNRWLRGDGLRGSGEYHWLFDNDLDGLQIDADKVGFDITWLMETTSPLISDPVYLYIVHLIRQSLDERLTTINIDEAFQVFKSPFWEPLLTDWLPTIRKKNGHFVFSTQSPETVINSALSPVILHNASTKIIFSNPAASPEIYINHLGLTASEYETVITTSPQSRLFLYKQDDETILCKLDLRALADEIRVLSGNRPSVKIMERIIEEVGTNPDDWWPLFIKRSAA